MCVSRRQEVCFFFLDIYITVLRGLPLLHFNAIVGLEQLADLPHSLIFLTEVGYNCRNDPGTPVTWMDSLSLLTTDSQISIVLNASKVPVHTPFSEQCSVKRNFTEIEFLDTLLYITTLQ